MRTICDGDSTLILRSSHFVALDLGCCIPFLLFFFFLFFFFLLRAWDVYIDLDRCVALCKFCKAISMNILKISARWPEGTPERVPRYYVWLMLNEACMSVMTSNRNRPPTVESGKKLISSPTLYTVRFNHDTLGTGDGLTELLNIC